MSLTWSGDPHELRQLAAAIEQLRATAARGLPPAPDCETAISPPQEKGAGVASLAPADSAPAGLAEFEVVDPRQSDAASSASAVDVWQECEDTPYPHCSLTLEEEIDVQLARIRQILKTEGAKAETANAEPGDSGALGNAQESASCIACLSSKRRCVIIAPCGHQCLCRRCAEKVAIAGPRCPLCRIEIEGFILHASQRAGHASDGRGEPKTLWLSPAKNRGTSSDAKIETAVPILLLIAILGSLLSLAFSD